MTPTQKIIEEFKEKFSKPELKRVECEGVGDNNGFYEFTPKIITVENIEDFLPLLPPPSRHRSNRSGEVGIEDKRYRSNTT